MRNIKQRLFAKGGLYSVLERKKNEAAEAVANVSSDQILASTDDQIVAHFEDKFSITPLILYPDQAEKALTECFVESRDSFTYDIHKGQSIRVPGVKVTVKVPFSGDAELLSLTPNTMTLTAAYADISKPERDGIGWLTYQFSFDQHSATADSIQREVDSVINYTTKTIKYQQAQITQFQHELIQVLQSAISSRRSRLGGIHTLAKALNIPVTERPGMPSLTPIAVAKKVIRELPPVADAKQSSGFSITDRAYESILAAIRAQGRTFEKAPATFAKFDEEELRDVILGNLNTHFEGQATGETFRARGKTDICIEQENRAAFVGECKIWRGAKELVDGLHQLLGYLTWRDCKAALVVFNKDRSKFSEILDKAPSSLRDCQNLFNGESAQAEPGEWRMKFKSPDDDDRIVTVHLLVYNLYTTR